MPTKARFARKLQWFAMGIILSASAAMALILHRTEDRVYDDRLAKVRSVVEAAWGVAGHYASEAKAGTISEAEAKARATAALRALRYDGNEYFWINDTVPTMVMHPIKPEMEGNDLRLSKDPTGKPLFLAMVDTVRRNGAGFVDYQWPKAGSDKPVPKISYVKGIPQWGWIIGSGVYIDDVQAEINGQRIRFGVAILIGAILAIGVSAYIGRRLASPLVLAQAAAGEAAHGDLTVRAAVSSNDEMGDVAKAMNEMLERFATTVRGVRVASDQTTQVAREVAAAADTISSGAQRQAASLEETAASLEEITATVKQNAENAQQANALASSLRDRADAGGAVVGRAVSAMTDMNQSAHRIAEIIGTIDEIAFQTNLLALNAAVEAARAGEQGRGFAVVATEVRSLAQRSGAAAKEIRTLIQDSVTKVERGSELVTASGQTLDEIVEGVKRVSDIVQEIASASKEQAIGVDQVNEAVSQMDRVVQANAAHTEELASSAQMLSQQAENLQSMMARFRVDDRGARPAAAAAAATWADAGSQQASEELVLAGAGA